MPLHALNTIFVLAAAIVVSMTFSMESISSIITSVFQFFWQALVDRQQEYARPATSTLGAVGGGGWSSLSVDKERGSFFTAAIKQGMEKPTTLLNPSHIDPNPKALRFDNVKRYETSEIGMGQKRSSEIKFHCRPRIELGTKDTQKTR